MEKKIYRISVKLKICRVHHREFYLCRCWGGDLFLLHNLHKGFYSVHFILKSPQLASWFFIWCWIFIDGGRREEFQVEWEREEIFLSIKFVVERRNRHLRHFDGQQASRAGLFSGHSQLLLDSTDFFATFLAGGRRERGGGLDQIQMWSSKCFSLGGMIKVCEEAVGL